MEPVAAVKEGVYCLHGDLGATAIMVRLAITLYCDGVQGDRGHQADHSSAIMLVCTASGGLRVHKIREHPTPTKVRLSRTQLRENLHNVTFVATFNSLGVGFVAPLSKCHTTPRPVVCIIVYPGASYYLL